ncbi:MAG: MFS transporter [Anaerolineae bacterium]|nr:MFS transporter [Anaerolineae bacterium]
MQSTLVSSRVNLTSYLILLVGCASGITMGTTIAGNGTMMNDLAFNTKSSIEAAGIMSSLIFLSSLVTQLIAGVLIDRLGTRPVILAGSLAFGVGVWLCALASSLPMLYGAALVAGLGFGALGLGSMTMITAAFPEQRVRYIGLINVFFGIGTVIGPFVGGIALSLTGSAIAILWLAGGIAFLILFTVLWGIPLQPVAGIEAKTATISRSVYLSLGLWLCGLVVVLYSGLENGLGVWGPLYLNRSLALTPEIAAFLISAYYLMLTLGRVIVTVIGVRIEAHKILLVSAAGTLAGISLLVFGHGNTALTIIAALLMGISFGPIFPTMFALATAAFPQSPGKVGSIIASAGSLGGALFIPLNGAILERAGTAPMTFYLLIISVLMIGFYGAVHRVMTGKAAAFSV